MICPVCDIDIDTMKNWRHDELPVLQHLEGHGYKWLKGHKSWRTPQNWWLCVCGQSFATPEDLEAHITSQPDLKEHLLLAALAQ